MSSTELSDEGRQPTGDVRVESVSQTFTSTSEKERSTLTVLQDVNCEIAPKQFVSIIGPSGCGKTTLLRIIAGLVTPTTGAVYSGGRRVTAPSKSSAMVFQDANLMPWRNAMSNVEFGLDIHGVGKSERRVRARAAMELAGLKGFESHYPSQLSGGMRQRVGLARALCTRPQLLLMDEPFGALDMMTRAAMQQELLRIWEADRKTVIFVTHSIEEAVLLSDAVIVMAARPGRVHAVLPIDLPRPRTYTGELETGEQFIAYRRQLAHLLAESEDRSGSATSPTSGGRNET